MEWNGMEWKGINREKVGEILKVDEYWYVYCLKPIGTFLFYNGLKFSGQDLKFEIMNDNFINFPLIICF